MTLSLNPRWFVLRLNPEPWVVPPASVGRKGGKLYVQFGRDEQLANYKEAVREAMGDGHEKIDGPVDLTFYFSRETAAYTTPREVIQRKHDADATNLQKATEDALQGVLYDNDKDVHSIRSVMLSQGPNSDPFVVIRVDRWVDVDPDEIPHDVWKQLEAPHDTLSSATNNTWPPTSTPEF